MRKNRVLRLLGYVALSGACFVGVYIVVIRPWHQQWGATNAEAAAPMAGRRRSGFSGPSPA